jgi:hypothetical protein
MGVFLMIGVAVRGYRTVKNVCFDPLSWITKVAKGFRQSLVLRLGPGLRGEHGLATLAPVRGNLFRMTTVAEITGAVKRSP